MKLLQEPVFKIFSASHIVVLILILFIVILLFMLRKRINLYTFQNRCIERIYAVTLLLSEVGYHIWMWQTNRWHIANSLPLELCSISLLVAICLLWTGKRIWYPFVFFAGIGGAIQAILTPDLDIGFPHFRFIHFFYTHTGIILTALYFTWVKGMSPTFKDVIKTILIINAFVPGILLVNYLFDANYMFLKHKPLGGSLLDYLGTYPWAILSLELVAFIVFTGLWIAFRERKKA